MPTYDPLALLERANAHASNWQSALDRAIAQQTAMNNAAFADGFARDRVFQMYPSELNRMQAGNVYQAQLADMQTRLLPDQEAAQRTAYRLNSSQNGLALQESQWAYSPDNTAARRTVADDRLQSPAAQLRAGAASYGVIDPLRREAVVRQTLAQTPDALSAQAGAAAPFAATQVGQAIDRLLTGDIGAADAQLQQLGLGRLSQQPDGKLVLLDPQGRSSMPLSAQEAAMVLQSRTGQPGTPLQAYGAARTQAAQAAMLKRFEQQAEVAKEDAKARNTLRLELLKAAADPMATPESRIQLEQLAQRYGLDLGTRAAVGATPGGLPPAVAAAAYVPGAVAASTPSASGSAFSAITGLGTTPVARGATDQPASNADTRTSRTTKFVSESPSTRPITFEAARQSTIQAQQALQGLIDQRAALTASVQRLEGDIVAKGGRITMYGVVGGGPDMAALRSTHERLREELRQIGMQLRTQEAQTWQATAELRRMTREHRETQARTSRQSRADAAYEAYRP